MSVAARTLAQRTPAARGLVLIALFGITAVLLQNVNPASTDHAPRWPTERSAYAVDGWRVAEPAVDDTRPGLTMVTRVLTSDDKAVRGTVVLSTSPIAKAIYRAGPDVPFLGAGYRVEPVARTGPYEAFVASRGTEAWLQISVFGERRGQFGTGAVAWTLSTVDSIFGMPNDYYLARVVVPYEEQNTERTIALANALFPKLAAYYAD